VGGSINSTAIKLG